MFNSKGWRIEDNWASMLVLNKARRIHLTPSIQDISRGQFCITSQKSLTYFSRHKHPEIALIQIERIHQSFPWGNIDIPVHSSKFSSPQTAEPINYVQHLSPLSKNQDAMDLPIPQRQDLRQYFQLAWATSHIFIITATWSSTNILMLKFAIFFRQRRWICAILINMEIMHKWFIRNPVCPTHEVRVIAYLPKYCYST